MSRYNIDYNGNDDRFDEIRQRLNSVRGPVAAYREFRPAPVIKDIPPVGHYSVPLESSVSATSFGKSPRFTSVNKGHADVSSIYYVPSTFRNSSVPSINSYRDDRSALKTLANEYSVDEYSINSQNKSHRGSFPKAIRKTVFNTGESCTLGPAAYSLDNQGTNNTSGYSFGIRSNSVPRDLDMPGPGAYRPEDTVVNANHIRKQGPIILKGDHKLVENNNILKKGLTGDKYYENSYYSSFDDRRPSGSKYIMGTGPKSSPFDKSLGNIPGPGTYHLPSPFNPVSHRNGESTTPRKTSLFAHNPTISRSFIKEDPPGPAEYSPYRFEKSRYATKIGTSVRPGFAPQKEALSTDASIEMLKPLRRVAKLNMSKLNSEVKMSFLSPTAKSSPLGKSGPKEQKVSPIAKSSPKAQSKIPSPKGNNLPKVRSRLFIFEEIAKKSESPGFEYDVMKYKQIGSESSGGKMGKSARMLVSENKSPGPGKYELAKDELKSNSEVKFAKSKRPEHFVRKDSQFVPGVGNYNAKDLQWGGIGGAIPTTKKGLMDEKTEKRWEKRLKGDTEESYYQFIEDLEKKIEEMANTEPKEDDLSTWCK